MSNPAPRPSFPRPAPPRLGLALALLACCATAAAAREDDTPFQDFHFTGTLGGAYTEGDYGTTRNTNVELALPAVSVETGGFRLTASLPYMRISGRGLVVFDANGNPVVINRNTALAPDVRTGWGDLNLSGTYTIPAAILDDFEVRLTALGKVPTGSARRRLSTGSADYGGSIDVSRKFGAWSPFVTVGYLVPGNNATYTLYNTVSVSAGTALELRDDLVAVASYDFDSASTPLVQASHQLFGSLTWIRGEHMTLTGYTTAGLSDGSPSFGAGLLVSYNLD